MIETYPSVATLAEAAAHAVEAGLVEALDMRGRASLVATGGRSPGPVYDRLQDARLDWARVVVTLSDERCVPEDHPESNAGLVRRRLMTGPPARAHLLPLWPEPEPAALEALLPFDVVMLGMGEDGHIASLIPGDPGLAAALSSPQLTVAVPAGLGTPPLSRTSLTLSALLQARAIFLLISGEAKRQVLARAVAGEPLPVGRLLAGARNPVRVFWSPNAGE